MRVQAVTADSWPSLRYFMPEPDTAAFLQITGLYRDYIVPKYPWLYEKLVFFSLPEDVRVPSCGELPYGTVSDPTVRAAVLFRKGLRVHGDGSVRTRMAEAEALWQTLTARGCTAVVPGLRPGTVLLPVDRGLGFLSRSLPNVALKANLSFFTMDRIDCMTPYDRLGTPFGFRVKDGVIEAPPLFGREALIVRENGHISVERPSLTELEIEIEGRIFVHGKNCACFSRPEYRKTPAGKGRELVIVNGRVLACRKAGNTEVPSSGFVLRYDDGAEIAPGAAVLYHGFEDAVFGIQVGNSAVCFGEPVLSFRSSFYNIRRPFSVSYPPSLYPLGYDTERAPRMVLGADADDLPMLLFFEGAAKFGHNPAMDSRGVSLSEAARFSQALGMTNGVHLDGGGSAQILLSNRRALSVSDRDPETFSEKERAVPIGLCAD